MRVYELAKLVGKPCKIVQRDLTLVGCPVKSPSSTIQLLPIEQEAVIGWLSTT